MLAFIYNQGIFGRHLKSIYSVQTDSLGTVVYYINYDTWRMSAEELFQYVCDISF